MSVSYSFTPETVQLVLGANDANIPYLEMLLSADLSLRGTAVSSDKDIPFFIPFMRRLEKAARERGALKEAEIFMEFQYLSSFQSSGRFQKSSQDINPSFFSLVRSLRLESP